MNEKLEIPKQMRIENIANKYKNKFIAMMDAEPLIKIDTLYLYHYLIDLKIKLSAGSQVTSLKIIGRASARKINNCNNARKCIRRWFISNFKMCL